MNKIIRLKNKDGEKVYPVTPISAVECRDGRTLSDIVNKLEASTSGVPGEQEIGSMDINGFLQPLYQRVLTLQHLPVTPGEEYSFYIDGMIGYNSYIAISEFSAYSGTPTGLNSIYTGCYSIGSVTTSEDGRTVLKVKCESDVNEILVSARVVIRYVKFYGEEIEISVKFPDGTDAEDIKASIPYLFANKQAMFNYTYDDQTAAVLLSWTYASGHRYLPAGNYFWHVYDPNKKNNGYAWGDVSEAVSPLYYTDGCGTDRRVTFDIACWFAARNSKGEYSNTYESYSDCPTLPYLNLEDAKYLLDFGNRLCIHDLVLYDVVDGVWTEHQRKNINDNFKAVEYVATSFEELFQQLAIGMLEPSGDINHCIATFNNNPVRIVGRQATGTYNVSDFPLLSEVNRTKLNITNRVWAKEDKMLNTNEGAFCIRYFDSSTEIQTNQIEGVLNAQSDEGKVYVGTGSHNDKGNGQNHLSTIVGAYGKNGSDNVWFCTIEELYEYQWIRNTAIITEKNDGNIKTLKICIPKFRGQRNKEFTLLLDGVTSTNGITVTTSENVYHQTNGVDPVSGNMMVNIDYSPFNYENAKKYLQKYKDLIKESPVNAAEYALDCRYLCGLINSDLATPLLNQLPKT